jgi:polyhydroxybutyrate depolymerase
MRWLVLLMAVFALSLLAACTGSDDDAGGPSVTAPSGSPAFTVVPEPTRFGRVPPGAARSGTPTRRSSLAVPAMRSAGCGSPFAATGTVVETIQAPDGERSYRLHVPTGYNNRRPAPLVLNFHGYAQSAEQQEAYSGLVPLSDSTGFILVTPEGSGSPAGWDIAGVYNDDGTDDIVFVGNLVAHLSDVLCIDQARVFATGHSNGAEMASQLACQEPQLIAAFAPVSGAVYQGCEGAGVPMIAFQGTADWNVEYEWSADAVDEWAAHNGCEQSPASTRVSEHVELRTWPGCTSGDVLFYVIEDGGHTWPGADPELGGVGETTSEINASQLMWQFFQAHPKK